MDVPRIKKRKIVDGKFTELNGQENLVHCCNNPQPFGITKQEKGH